ncbi:MFS general substrate transporter [Cucurbitaria berberidis CBS 394.84]|uniref:MFS general substrate transporter n=1 Tax=Cucurbitaria berberidis CBS 394.84 TaxID=1168544 RepID=A0A9P4GI79_9PLEO|nr:MFS general substrate transporter [Cucurbitaria berberidis CBS 394.84]KAF1846060.1 MFS general substrate transporter [Cucurbitaria berberidis CBS 394.84]
MKILVAGNVDEVVDPVAENKLVRKIDMYIMPFLCITYLITYIDKATLGYAAVFDLPKDLHLHGTQYSWLSSIFYFGFLIFEYPTNFFMQKLSVSKWLAVNIFLWGGITMAQGGVNHFEPFMALRFIMGMLESCATPATILLIGMWYKIEEQPIRIGIWAMFLGISNAFGGLLAFGIGHIQGSFASWRYQFIIVGAVSSVWAIVVFFGLAENAASARWLSPEQRILAVQRLRVNNTGIKNKEIKRYQIVEALLDPKTWFFFFFGVSTQVVNGAASNFGSLIIKGFGFTTLKTTLLQIPYGFLILVANISAMYIQRWLPGQRRCIVAIVYVLVSLVGIIGVYTIPRHNHWALLVCYWLTGTYTVSYSMALSLITANIGGYTKRSTVTAIFFISYCTGNIVGPFAFKPSEAPKYQSGIIAILVAYCVEIALFALFAVYVAMMNRKKQSIFEELGPDADNEQARTIASFNDLTDKENVFFRYTY